MIYSHKQYNEESSPDFIANGFTIDHCKLPETNSMERRQDKKNY